MISMQGSGPLQRLRHIHVHSKLHLNTTSYYLSQYGFSPRLELQGSVLAGLPIPNAEQFNPTFWQLNAFKQPFYKCRWCFERFVLERGIPSFGWQGESIFSVPILISIALVTPEIGGLFEWRVNPWSGAIWLIWTVLAKAKTTRTHWLKFWNTFLGSGDLKTDVENSPSFFHDHFGILSQYIRVVKRLSPLSRSFYSWLENTDKEFSLWIVLRP